MTVDVAIRQAPILAAVRLRSHALRKKIEDTPEWSIMLWLLVLLGTRPTLYKIQTTCRASNASQAIANPTAGPWKSMPRTELVSQKLSQKDIAVKNAARRQGGLELCELEDQKMLLVI